jgi:hypothetical protein
MRTGRVVYTQTDDGAVVVGQVASFDQSGLQLQPTKDGNTIFCEPGKAHKLNYKLIELIKNIGIEEPAFSVGDGVYVRTEGKLGQVASVSEKTLVVAFTKELQKRVKPEDVVNLKNNGDIAAIVQENVGIELGSTSAHAPHSAHTLSQSLGEGEEEEELQDEEDAYEQEDQEDDEEDE